MTNPGPTPAPGPAPAPASRTIRSLGLHLSRLLLWLLGENVVLFWRRHRSLSIAGLLLAASYLAYLACSTQLHTAIAPGGYASLLWAGTSEATAAILSSWLSRGGAKLWLSLSLVADLGMAVASVQCLRCVIIRKDEADSKAVADSTWLVIVSWLVLVASLVQTGAVGCLCWRVGLWGQTGSGTAIPDLGIMPAVLAGAFFLRILCLGVATGYLAWQCRESYFLRMAARSLREFARILNWTAPAGVLTAVLCCVALPFDQFRETLRVTFDPTSPLGPCLWVFGGTLLFSLSVWYLPRALVVTVLEHDPTRSRHERRGMDSTHAEYWGAVLPRVYGLMPFLSLAHNLHLSGSLVTDVYHRASLGRAVGAAVLFCLVMAVLMATLARRLRQVRAAQGGPLNRGFVPWLARCAGGIRETLNHIQQPRMQQAAGSAALRVERVQQKLQADASRLSLLLFTQGIGFLVAALYAGLAGWGYCHGYAYAARNGALGTLLCGLAGISALGIGATWLRVRYGAPVLSPLLLLAAVLSWYGFNDNHQVRVLPASVGAVPAAASPRTNGQPGGLDPFEPAFETWLHQRPGYNRRYVNETPYPVVLVAAEGGGIRAACEAAQTLAYLQDRFPGWEENLSIKDRRFHGFRDHLFAVSGVSGGSVGASVFAALCLREQLLEQIGTQGAMREAQSQVGAGAVTPTPPLAPSDWNNVCKQILREDLLAPAAAALTCGDFLQAFWPRPVPELDRAQAIEKALESAWADHVPPLTWGQPPAARAPGPMAQTGQPAGQEPQPDPRHYPPNLLETGLAAFGAGFATGSTPALFLNATRVDTGDRMVLATIPAPNVSPLEGHRARRLTSLAEVAPGTELRLSTAAFVSARFTYVSPSAALPIRREGSGTLLGWNRYVDGGYYENSGAATLLDVLRALHRYRRKQTSGWTIPFRVIVLRIGFCLDEQAAADPPKSHVRLDELGSPLYTLFNTRDGRARHAVTLLRSEVEQMRREELDLDSRTTAPTSAFVEVRFRNRERERQPGLPFGWLISRAAQEEIDAQIREKEDPYAEQADPRANNRLSERMRRLLPHLRYCPEKVGKPGR